MIYTCDLILNTEHNMFLFFIITGYLVPRSHCQHFADMFIAMNKYFTAEWRKWLQDCLALEGFPSGYVTKEQKSKFIMKLSRYCCILIDYKLSF